MVADFVIVTARLLREQCPTGMLQYEVAAKR